MTDDIKVIANTPQELEANLNAALNTLWEKRDQADVADSYIILNDKSLLSIDFKNQKIWFYDFTYHRPAPLLIKETLAKFLWDKMENRQE